MSHGDLDRDGRISREEFASLAQGWFEAWDSTGTGRIDGDQMRAGLDTLRNPSGGGITGMLLAAEESEMAFQPGEILRGQNP
jgi:hypothetical protein